MTAPNWRRYLRFWRSDVRGDFDDELAFHVQERVDDLVARGMHPAAAHDEAMRRFGNIDQVREHCLTEAAERESQMRRMETLEVLTQDTIYALRTMRTRPSLTAAIVLTIALGIGATTSIFSVVNAVLLRPLPYQDADRVVMLREVYRGNCCGSVSPGHFHDWTEQTRSFAATAASQGQTYNLTEGDPARLVGLRVTPAYFDVFSMPATLGRYFLAHETEASRVTVLSHDVWQNQFAGEAGIVGRQIRLNGAAHTVVGVAPKAYSLTPYDARLWTILTFTPEQRINYGAHTFQVAARLQPGVTEQQARADVERVTEDIRRRVPNEMKERGADVTAFNEVLIGDYRTQLWVLLGAVVFVLLIGCVNVASLLLARASTRRKEIAIRGALGGARSRLVRQLLTESVLLAIVGGALGVLVARVGVSFLVGTGPAFIPRLAEAGLQLDVLGFAALATLACGVLFGLAPALRATRLDLQAELRDGGRGSRTVVRDRMRAGLIVAEIAVALVLLVSAGLFLRSAQRLQRVQIGFDPSHVTMMRVALPPDRYDSATTVVRAFNTLLDEVRSIPGVVAAGAGTRVPMWGISIDFGMQVEGRGTEQMAVGHMRIVTPGYFETLGISLRRGRYLGELDNQPNAPRAIVVNETYAQSFFPNEDPIGKRVSGWQNGPEPEWREIVGVVADIRAFGQDQTIPAELYAPAAQANQAWWNAHQRNMTIVVKADERAEATLGPALRAAVKRFDATLPLFHLQPMGEVLAQSTAQRRFSTMLLTLLGFTGLVLAAIGIYGVIAFFVSQRTHEIGVRIALGASRYSVIGLVVRQALTLAVAGVALGAVLAWWATRAFGSMLFEIQARDPLTFGLGALVLLLAATGAAFLPARRAARVSPVLALSESA
ncbi:MAG: ABC transporter permease [Gemmatimonadaceae bacterium]